MCQKRGGRADEREVVDPFVLPPIMPLPRRRTLEGRPGSSR